ncbi:endonuclease/exonuclease/phosphatase family protein [Desertivirga xinjiangensis]|uniref:endonuclease/exonuclease/phosphatase family protein n=1 Tax=Desertivirga xinjiangensis TaxID=539206 RepID=UPI00210C8B98|nr:endonuclease/exonuclease/phosphatase family protein [Pedobacter xinjiangensis]
MISIFLFAGLCIMEFADPNTLNRVITALLGLNIGYLFYQVYPFLRIAKKQVLHAGEIIKGQSIVLLTANVFQYNRNDKMTLANIALADPDVILLLETDKWWHQSTKTLKQRYPYSVEVPLENTYGMLLYSRYRIEESSVQYLVEADVPSIHAVIKLPSGQDVQLYCVHPTPPVPNENPRSTERDKELLLIARRAKNNRLPVIVMGDLNDVAWSYTTKLFSKISGLLDPRKGRGFFNTFHARYPILRFPLDHIFCSNEFKLMHISKLPAAGSDHFPMYVKLQYEKSAPSEQEEPQADEKEEQIAEEKLEK